MNNLGVLSLEVAKKNLPRKEYEELCRTLRKLPTKFTDDDFPWQSNFILHPSRRKALIATRRGGKSSAAGRYFFHEAFATPGCSMVYIGLTRESAKRIMVKDILNPLIEKFQIKVEQNKTELSFTFPNGSVLYLLGMDSSEDERKKVYGQKIKLAIIDEAALYAINLRDLVYSTLAPACMDLKGTIVLMGMPSSRPTGIFFDLTKDSIPIEGQEWDILDPDPDQACEWHGFAWSAVQNPYMRELYEAEVAEMRRLNPNIDQTPIFKQEWLGLWTQAGAYVFGECGIYDQLPPLEAYAMGVDLGYSTGKKSDSSSGTVMGYGLVQRHDDDGSTWLQGQWFVLEVINFREESTEGVQRFRDFVARWPHCAKRIRMYGAGIEKGTTDFFRKEGFPVVFIPTNKRKLVRALPMATKWNEKRINVPRAAPWLKAYLDQLHGFTGTTEDEHDDMVDSGPPAFDQLPDTTPPRRAMPKAPKPPPPTQLQKIAKEEEKLFNHSIRQSKREQGRGGGHNPFGR